MSLPAGPRVLLISLLLLFAVWAGFRLHSSGSKSAAFVTVPAGQASPAIPSDAAADASLEGASVHAAAIPEVLPTFSINDLQGRPTSAAAWPGKSLVMNFWATWCAPCQREVPLLKALSSEWSDRNVEVVGIAVDHPDKVQGFAEQFKIPYPLLVGEQNALDLATQLGLSTPVFPFTVFTDRRGHVVALFVGELHRPQADLILSVLQNLNQDKVQLPDARLLIAEGLDKLADQHAG
jgi:thiol-disulfide isomerase/thioredoxin